MNALTPKRYLLPQSAPAIGTLICSGYQFSETTWLDLYGTHDEVGGYCVETATICGTPASLHDFLDADQLDSMSERLNNPSPRN